jgi:aldose sugar dehydrogenase
MRRASACCRASHNFTRLTGFLVGILSIAIFASSAEPAETYSSKAGVQFRVVEVAKGLSHPWSLAFLPGGDMLVTERLGRLRLVRDGRLQSEAIAGTPKVYVRAQGGLFDVVLHPKFSDNHLLYLSYFAEGRGGTAIEVMRARLDGSNLADGKVIFRAEPTMQGNYNLGSRLLFLPDGTMLITVGDRFTTRDQSQNLENDLGKIIRLNDDGSIPDDNPFQGKPGAKPEIFVYGTRNSQGLALRPGTSEIWETEHGPRGGDEVNILKAGANYGWPKITYGIDYDGSIISNKKELPGMEQPVVYWVPSIAPSGTAFYSGDKFPNWKGDLFVGALKLTHLRRLKLDGQKVTEQEILLEGMRERIRDVRSGPDGFLYLLTDESNGRLLRLEPAGS